MKIVGNAYLGKTFGPPQYLSHGYALGEYGSCLGMGLD